MVKRFDKRGRAIETGNIGAKPRPAQEKILEIAESLSPKEIYEVIEALKKLL